MAENDPEKNEPNDAETSPEDQAPSERPDPDADADGAAEATGGRTAAEDLAADALRAAQEAVSQINAGQADAGATAASDEADAAMAAMMAGQGAAPLSMPAFKAAALEGAPEGIDLLSDVNLDVKIELGRTRMFVEDVLKLSEGAVVELDKLAGDPVDVYVNQRLVARGEVLILNDNFCVRINDIVPSQREAAG